MIGGKTRLALHGGPGAAYSGFVDKAVEDLPTVLNLALALAHPYSVGGSLSHHLTVSPTVSHPFALGVALEPEVN